MRLFCRKIFVQRHHWAFAFLLFVAPSGYASPRYYDLMLFDFPYTMLNTTRVPSMQQSLAWSNSFYEFGHQNIAEAFEDRPTIGMFSALAFDFVSIYVPLGNSWLHEEWHRSVMGQFDISSYNGIYHFRLSDTIPVDNVKDFELSWLKANHPVDFIRLSSAGFEAQYEQIISLEKQLFFYDTGNRHQLILLLNSINSISYIYTCGSNSGTRATNEIIASESTDISQRDFTGFDCTAWVYDLFRPNEPYSARGIHPSGVGVNRYRTLDHLTNEERAFLKQQFYLSLLNLLDPLQFNFTSFGGSDENAYRWNASLQHYLAPFGYSIATRFFFRSSEYKLLGTLHHHANRHRYFPGFELEWFDIPTHIGSTELRNRIRAGWWQQPKDLLFNSTESEMGGFINIRAEFDPASHWSPYLEFEYKTNGWLAGEVYLDKKLVFRLGFDYRR